MVHRGLYAAIILISIQLAEKGGFVFHFRRLVKKFSIPKPTGMGRNPSNGLIRMEEVPEAVVSSMKESPDSVPRYVSCVADGGLHDRVLVGYSDGSAFIVQVIGGEDIHLVWRFLDLAHACTEKERMNCPGTVIFASSRRVEGNLRAASGHGRHGNRPHSQCVSR